MYVMCIWSVVCVCVCVCMCVHVSRNLRLTDRLGSVPVPAAPCRFERPVVGLVQDVDRDAGVGLCCVCCGS
jgi:hypothetical protein